MNLAREGSTNDAGLSGVVPFRFACHRCARCCTVGSGHVWLEPAELARLAAALGMQEPSFVSRFVRRSVDPRTGASRLSLREERADGGRCALLVGANECSVYAARPDHCKSFPYWSSVLADRDAFERAREVCPGIAVEVDADRRTRAFARLTELYGEVDAVVRERAADRTEPEEAGGAKASTCRQALASGAEPYVTGLEADYYHHRSADPGPPHTCAGRGACPLACRLAAFAEPALYEHFHERVRSIEAEFDYPRSYGAMTRMLAARATDRDGSMPARC